MKTRRKRGQRFTPEEKQTIHDMIVAGNSYREIIQCVGCCKETIAALKHKINGTKPRPLAACNAPFLSNAQAEQIGEAEADRLQDVGRREILYTGWYDSDGNWRAPKFPAGEESRSLD